MKPINIDSLVWKSADEDEARTYPGRVAAFWQPSGKRAYLQFHGLCCHIYALRVHDVGHDQEQMAWDESFEADVSDMQGWAQGRLAASKLPDLEGDWILWLQPFAAS